MIRQPVGTFAELGFEARPGYIPNDVIIPTFDDVPERPYTAADGNLYKNFGDGDWTKKMLDFLDENDLHVDFFINTNNFCDTGKNPGCMKTIERILKTQNAANHTVHHSHMGGGTGYKPNDLAASSCSTGGGQLPAMPR